MAFGVWLLEWASQPRRTSRPAYMATHFFCEHFRCFITQQYQPLTKYFARPPKVTPTFAEDRVVLLKVGK